MRTITQTMRFLVTAVLLLGCLYAHAADDDLITRQITIKLDEAGTLPDKIGDTKKYNIANLKIVGEINGTDLCLIRDMAGSNFYGNPTDGKLATLDLSEAKIVKKGNSYYNFYHLYYDDVIAEYAFYKCSSLTSITIPSTITSIEKGAFEGCTGLTSITIPSSVTWIGRSAFSGCTGLTSITIPSNVTSIGESAFSGCSGLTNFTIPSTITSIEKGAFKGCTGLTSITIPSTITSIGGSAFSGCTGLTSITIPDSVTSIGESAFSGCTGLTGITIPSAVTSIGESAFSGCTGLDSVYVSWDTPTAIPSNTFQGVNTKKCILYIPKGSYDNYWLTDWGVFENIVEYEVTGINNAETSADAQEIARYSADGQRLYAPTKGLNIVKYSDGSTRKVMVR